MRLALTDLEVWVSNQLEGWLIANQESENACRDLAELIDTYANVAISVFKGEPESLSFTFLTSMSLWVALDLCAINRCHLLSDYDPGISPELFESLLLPKKYQMEQLMNLEQYLQKG